MDKTLPAPKKNLRKLVTDTLLALSLSDDGESKINVISAPGDSIEASVTRDPKNPYALLVQLEGKQFRVVVKEWELPTSTTKHRRDDVFIVVPMQSDARSRYNR